MEYPSKVDCPTGIYKIVNNETKTAYVGQTSIDLIGRWKSHIKTLQKNSHRNPRLQYAWNKYGGNLFTASVELYIPYVNDVDLFYETLDYEERRILKLYPDHYNLMEAGEDRMIFSEESRARSSHSAKNRNITKEEREIWETNRLAAVRSIESRQKRSEAHKRMWADPEYQQILVAAYNKPEAVKKKSDGIKASFTPKRKQKYTQLNLDRWADPEYKDRLRKSLSAAHTTPGGKERYSEGMKKGWIKRRITIQSPEYQAKRKEIKEARTKNKALELLEQSNKDKT